MGYMLQEIRQQPEILARILNHSLAAIRPLSERFRSGRPRFVIVAARGTITVGITNKPSSTLAETAEYVLPVCAGKEQSIAATKTYTGQLLVLYLIAAALGDIIPAQLFAAHLAEVRGLDPDHPRTLAKVTRTL
jgi:fructoselysine-6-P-deglycase FrlB-like protein